MDNDLISRAAAIDSICGCFNIMEAQGVDMTVARAIVKSVLDNAPAIDAVPERYVATMKRQGWVKPVRCENCKKWERDQDPMDERLDTHLCTRCMFFTSPDDYCSYAEAIDDADGETPLSR